MADILTKEKRSWNMSRIKGKDTKPEVLLRSMLHKEGFRFRIHVKHLQGKPDIVLPRYRSVVFVNGCFWHRHCGCEYAYNPKSRIEFWKDKFEKTVSRDKEKVKRLVADGWRVFIVWECEINKEPNKTLKKLINQLKASA